MPERSFTVIRNEQLLNAQSEAIANKQCLQWQNRVFKDSVITPNQKLVLLCLSMFANDKLEVDTEIVMEIARYTNIREREVMLLLDLSMDEPCYLRCEDMCTYTMVFQ